MEKIRIEIHLEKKEVKIIDKIAVEQGRSRKNLCETEIKKIIKKEIFDTRGKIA